MLAGKDIVKKLIPQGEKMRMVDSLLFHDAKSSRTGFQIEEDNIFNVEGLFSEEGIIENMAQSAALRIGWTAIKKDGEAEFYPPVGVIGAVKKFSLYRNPSVKTQIITEIAIQAEFFNATMIHGKVMQDGELLAEAELKIFIQDNQSNT